MSMELIPWWRWPLDFSIAFIRVWLWAPIQFLITFSQTTAGLYVGAVVLAFSLLATYNILFHPLARYPGPWYAKVSSLPLALMSWYQKEPTWLHIQARRFGTDKPIRISPSLLLFPKPSSLKDIYREPKLNNKSPLYGTGMLGPPHLFSTLDSEDHRILRKALGGPTWSIGALKKTWESEIDHHVRVFVEKMKDLAKSRKSFCLSDRSAEFAADIMTTLSFSEPWGFIANGRDERGILESWRYALDRFGFVGRFVFLRDHLMKIPMFAKLFLPDVSDDHGMGYLLNEANRIVAQREDNEANGMKLDRPDFLQYALDARIDGHPLSLQQKRAHATVLIQAGADTTGTSIGSTLRFISSDMAIRNKAVAEIERAEKAGKLSFPIQYEETVEHLPYVIACIKESLRLNPPATNLFARVVNEPVVIDGNQVPAGTEVTSYAYVVGRDPEMYGPDPNAFRPERWIEDKQKAQDMEAHSFVFGMGPRVCLGKEIATMELYKLIPEVIRQFDIEVLYPGEYVVAGGVAYNRTFYAKLHDRDDR